jgi:hypothetical protein
MTFTCPSRHLPFFIQHLSDNVGEYSSFDTITKAISGALSAGMAEKKASKAAPPGRGADPDHGENGIRGGSLRTRPG